MIREAAARRPAAGTFFLTLIYLNAFVIGAIVMAFEMLGSRYLNPYFGSGIFTWASLIATILLALSVGYFLGGWMADRWPMAHVLGAVILVASLYLLTVPLFAGGLFEMVFDLIEDVRFGSLIAAVSLMLFPVALLGVYSPFAIRLTLHATEHSGRVAGRIYGVSTLGSIVGTLVTTFYFIPIDRHRGDYHLARRHRHRQRRHPFPGKPVGVPHPARRPCRGGGPCGVGGPAGGFAGARDRGRRA